MSEFQIHHDVHEFISLLRLHGNEGAEQYIDLMQKNRTPYVTTSVSARSGKTVHYLQQNDKEKDEQLVSVSIASSTLPIPQSTSKISKQELEELRRQLGNVTTSVTSGSQPVEAAQKVLREKLNKNNCGLPVSVFPAWVYVRPALIGDFLPLSNPGTHVTVPIATSLDKGECLGGATLSLLHDRTFGYSGDSQAEELCLYLTKAAIAPYFDILERWIYRATSLDKGECLGGATLSLLHDRTFGYSGDSQAEELCLYLTKAASAPYFDILERWIYRGTINDPYK